MYSSSTLIKPSAMKKWPYKKGDNLVVFYYLGPSEICHCLLHLLQTLISLFYFYFTGTKYDYIWSLTSMPEGGEAGTMVGKNTDTLQLSKVCFCHYNCIFELTSV